MANTVQLDSPLECNRKEVNKMTKIEALKALNEKVPYEEAEYFNMVFATKISKGKQITDDEIRRTLMNGVEDEFITYGQSLTLLEMYRTAMMSL